jgi:hypothetical protein
MEAKRLENGRTMVRISKEELARRLARAAGLENGERGLETLLYGWKKFRKYGKKYCKALLNRDWMYIIEVIDFSEYAGYDLSHE